MLVFAAGAAGARFVASGLGGRVADGGHGIRRRRGDDRFDRSVEFWRFGRRSRSRCAVGSRGGRGFQDGEGSAETERGRELGVVDGFADGGEGARGEVLDVVVERGVTTGAGGGEGSGDLGVGAVPMIDGGAMDAGEAGGGGDGLAEGERIEEGGADEGIAFGGHGSGSFRPHCARRGGRIRTMAWGSD